MPFRKEIVRRKLLDIEQAVSRLRTWAPSSAQELGTDFMLCWAVERGLQVAAEALFDAGNHVLSGGFHETVNQYREIPVRLVAVGVIRAETGQRLAGLAGFRNVLVHDYAEVDLEKVQSVLTRLSDFEAFAADVLAWLDTCPD